MFLDGELWPEKVELRTHSHLQLCLANVGIDVISANPGVSVVRIDHPRQHVDQCSLASPVGTQQSEGLLLGHSQVETFHCRVGALEPLLYVQFSEVIDDQWEILCILHLRNGLPFSISKRVLLSLRQELLDVDVASRPAIADLPLATDEHPEGLEGEKRMPTHSELLWKYFQEVGAEEEENDCTDIQGDDAVVHFVSDHGEFGKAAVIRTADEHQVEKAVEGEGRDRLKPPREHIGDLVHPDTQCRPDHHGPDSEDIPYDVGTTGFVEQRLQEGCQADLGQDPPEGDDHQQPCGSLGEEGGIEYERPQEKEDEVGDDGEQEVEKCVDKPVAGDSHTVHLHHLHQLLLLLQHQPVQHHREEQAQRQWEDQGSHCIDDRVDEGRTATGVPHRHPPALHLHASECLSVVLRKVVLQRQHSVARNYVNGTVDVSTTQQLMRLEQVCDAVVTVHVEVADVVDRQRSHQRSIGQCLNVHRSIWKAVQPKPAFLYDLERPRLDGGDAVEDVLVETGRSTRLEEGEVAKLLVGGIVVVVGREVVDGETAIGDRSKDSPVQSCRSVEAVVGAQQGRVAVTPAGVKVPLERVPTGGDDSGSAIFVKLFAVLVEECVVAEDVGVWIILEGGPAGDVIRGEFLDDEGEDEADDWRHDLADVGAGLLGLQQPVLQEERLQLRVLLLRDLAL